MTKRTLLRWTVGLFVLLIINTAYVAAFASATLFYMANVLLHLALGLVVGAGFFALLALRADLWSALKIPAAFFGLSGIFGIYLAAFGALNENRWALWGHVAAAALGIAALAPHIWKAARSGVAGRRFRTAFASAVAAAVLLPAATAVYSRVFPNPMDRITNPDYPPLSMAGEGGGPQSPLWPSSARTNTGGLIPSNFFLDSAVCGECHKDIYRQWNSSVHHFASFNNQFYRKSIEFMQSVVGTKPSKWCAGCHDHAMFFNGRFDKPAVNQIDTPEAQAGLGCVSCHSIVHVDSTMGNGGFTIQYPPLHNLAASRNPAIRKVDQFLTYLNPEPHRRTFMKPFMRKDSAEFCSTCHKVHLDVPVNSYRWMRGFNDYDNWQASGVSGQGARSFYYPEKPAVCVDCHMPLVPSKDPGNHNGLVHSHRFPGANMAVAVANRDQEQIQAEESFLKSGFISVDIFAAAPADEPAGPAMWRRSGEAPRAMSTFAIGEESEQAGPVMIRDVGAISAPIGRAATRLRPGSTARVDVVVRTRKIGHFFPGGTVDAFDVWLEFSAKDAQDNVIFWSGMVEEGGKGPVEKGAHFYRAFLLDGNGQHINKRNAWQARSTLYVRLIPPGAADVAHFRLKIPPNAKGPLKLTARLNYRKFAHFYTQFAYEGMPANVSGQIKDAVPDLPILTLAQSEARLDLASDPVFEPVLNPKDRERWNDWGIGLLLQGDLKGAEYAFKKVTEAEPGYADGWLNVARALIQEGETDSAKPYIAKALSINPGLGRIHYFKALIEKADGDYDAALASLRKVESLYPKDRVVLNQIGRILFLKRQYPEAIQALHKVLKVDPEDLQAHYNLMLCYRGSGQEKEARREETLFRRFKADEASQALTATLRTLSPEDNNERQMIHDHESVPNLVP